MINNLINVIIPFVHADDPENVVGTISLPGGIPSDIGKTGDYFSVIVRFFIIIAGLFTLIQFLTGGFTYITSGGDKAKVAEAGNKITMSIIGLVVMAASFVIIAIVSQLLFGQFDFILNPVFKSV